MKHYFSQLRPLERRLVIGVAVIVFIVLNVVFVQPHFSDWSNLHRRLDDANRKLKLYTTAAAQVPGLRAQLKDFENEGELVAPEDQAINFMRTIQSQAAASGFGINNYSRALMHTNQFFMEQVLNINVAATESQLVDFLYKLGSGASMIRVRDLDLQPDPLHQRLNANVKLMASYQKNPSPASNSTAKPK